LSLLFITSPFSSGKALDKACERLLKRLDLYNVRNTPAAKYSGGMKRRLSVAIAVIGSPAVIFLDEPSTGLDPKSRQRLWHVLKRIKGRSSIVLTTHSMEEADAICDKIMIMAHGAVKCTGSFSFIEW
jgi:ABC-type multidrug transport system ATPase subunit